MIEIISTTITSSCDLWLNGSTFCHSTMTRGSIFFTGPDDDSPLACSIIQSISMGWHVCSLLLMTLSVRTSSPCLDTLPPQTVVRLIPKQTSTNTLGHSSKNNSNFEGNLSNSWTLFDLRRTALICHSQHWSSFLGLIGGFTESVRGLLRKREKWLIDLD